jgi:hypothetical protein
MSNYVEKVVRVRCPCCGSNFVDVTLVLGTYPEAPNTWTMDDYDPSECDCHDFVDRFRTKGDRPQSGGDFYRDKLEEDALHD